MIDLRALTSEMISQFDEIFQEKELTLTYTLENKEIYATPYLVEILLSNLLSNAIRHNHNGGQINIALTAGELVISNTGEGKPLPDEKIFTRFHKSVSYTHLRAHE